MNIVVIGSGAGAISAVETIRDLNKSIDITVISKEKAMYSPCIFPYYLSGDVDEKGLLFRDPGFYERMRVNVVFKKAEKIAPTQKLIFLEDGSEMKYDKLLIATGSYPISPEIKGMDKKGVFFLHTFEDVKKVVKWSENAKKVVVVGAGFIGTEVAISLRKKGMGVYLVEIRDRVLPEMLDKEMAEVVKKRLEENGIEAILDSQVSEIVGNEKVNGVAVDKGKIECDTVVIAVGVSPNIDIVKGTEVRTNAGIIVDEKMRTSVEDIYAVGDVVETIDIVTKERRVNAIWLNAVKQGRVAAYNLLGIEKEYEGSDRFNVVDIFGLPIVTIGHLLPDCEELVTQDKKVALKDNRVVRLAFIGDIKNAGVILSLMRKGTDISERITKNLF